ncbi:hypothetical protein Csa_002231 [Cucumis sativus]|nr:hypothetical protein Csa_002231 [Cucumis sativus]
MRELIAEKLKWFRPNGASDFRRCVLELDHSGFQQLQIKTSVPEKKNLRSILQSDNRQVGLKWSHQVERNC